MQKILADGQNGIPVLISQLTETARTKYQIADYWGDTRSGDVAYVYSLIFLQTPTCTRSECPAYRTGLLS
jgi:hypothetical protein